MGLRITLFQLFKRLSIIDHFKRYRVINFVAIFHLRMLLMRKQIRIISFNYSLSQSKVYVCTALHELHE